jgi:hypothetical protein
MWPPVRSESDAFRFTVAGALVIGASVLIGWLSEPVAGLVVFAIAVVSAAIAYVYVARRDHPAVLRQAASEARPHDGGRAGRHVLVVANVTLAGAELGELIRRRGDEHVEVDVLAPVLASRIHYTASDIELELADARTRLERSLAWARERRIAARGEVGDPSPTTAIEDELRGFGADELIVVTHPRDRETWQERGELARLRRELDVPVTHVVLRNGRASDVRGCGRGRDAGSPSH